MRSLFSSYNVIKLLFSFTTLVEVLNSLLRSFRLMLLTSRIFLKMFVLINNFYRKAKGRGLSDKEVCKLLSQQQFPFQENTRSVWHSWSKTKHNLTFNTAVIVLNIPYAPNQLLSNVCSQPTSPKLKYTIETSLTLTILKIINIKTVSPLHFTTL